MTELATSDDEPSFAPWRLVSFDDALSRLSLETVIRRPCVVAIDGRSAAGKTTLAAALAHELPGSCTVHTDEGIAFVEEWMVAERAFIAARRPWQSSDLVVRGTPDVAAPTGHVWIHDGREGA